MLNWEPSVKVDFQNPISFTLAIALPEFGGGMNIVDLSPERVAKLSPKERKKVLSNKRFYPYRVGYITIHKKLFYHEIALMRNEQFDNDRITLQGHGLLERDTWQIYW